MGIWCCADHGTTGNEISISMTSLRYLLTFAPMLDNFKSHVSNRHEIRGFNSTMINYCNENVLKKISTNFFFNGCFREISLRNYKKSSEHCVLPWFIRFHVFWNRASVLALRGLQVYKGHLQNERVIKPFLKHPKSSKCICIKSSLQCMHN